MLVVCVIETLQVVPAIERDHLKKHNGRPAAHVEDATECLSGLLGRDREAEETDWKDRN